VQKLTGKCLCEGIDYEITGEIGPIFNCHYSRCRRWHGAMFRTRSTIKKSQFKWLKGEELLFGIPLGGLDQAPNNKLEGHFFVGSKSPWYEITDDLPQYEEFPGSRQTIRATDKSV